MKYILSTIALWLVFQLNAFSIYIDKYVSETDGGKYFPIVQAGTATPIWVQPDADAGIIKIAGHLQQDINKVTGILPELIKDKSAKKPLLIIVGTYKQCPIITQLVKNKKINGVLLEGKRETFVIQIVDRPFAGVDRALVIAGSDKRGTIYGMYDLSQQIGVSPWYYWADVPVKQSKNLYVKPGVHSLGEPAVEYRGIFINDEAPALSGWVQESFGGVFNHVFYEKVFELILRMKGNFLWPAMWGRAFYDDDPENGPLANEYGIIIGTSHHEPMMRAHDEWRRYGQGAWNFETNAAELDKFWESGFRRSQNFETMVTVGMRGDGDMPMSEKSDIELMEKIIANQREIIEKVTGKPAKETPQTWALYKEVQEYYDLGMRVPDDVMLLLCDDNWGNVRKLPSKGAPARQGGYGMYYHFDYVGGPRNYKWLNTNPIPRIWEQMNLCYQYGVRKLWVVNVGDIKPMEYPIEFFLDMAWNPQQWNPDNLYQHTTQWVEQQFGKEYAKDIAMFLSSYAKYNARRKPELLSPETYSLINYREAERIVDEYNTLAAEAEAIYRKIPAAYKDAYYQLILFPIAACANLNELYVAAGKNRLYAKQSRVSTNDWAEKVKALFDKDAQLTNYYNKEMAGGKWNHMMDQTHIGYTMWQEPRRNFMPETQTITIPVKSEMRVAVEGLEAELSANGYTEAVLPEYDFFNRQSYYVDIFNTGQTSFECTLTPDNDLVIISLPKVKIDKGQRVFIEINWDKVPTGKHTVPVRIKNEKGDMLTVKTVFYKPDIKNLPANTFVESNGYISMEAPNYTKAINGQGIIWKVIPDMGRTMSAVTTFPVTSSSQIPPQSPCLEYSIYVNETGSVDVNIYLSPTLNFNANKGLCYAVSIDGETPQVVNFNGKYTQLDWNRWVADDIIVSTTKHQITKPGLHTLKYWYVDPAVVLQKIIMDTGGLKKSYLGPEESYKK